MKKPLAMNEQTLTLLQLNQRIAALMTVPDTQNVWVTAELSDVSVRGGHCYMELLQKHPDTGATLAKARGVIWAYIFSPCGRISQCYRSTIYVRAESYGASISINAPDLWHVACDYCRKSRIHYGRFASSPS